jgi:ubiquinone/menaquinone biosynthesis C-methylase UbiE
MTASWGAEEVDRLERLYSTAPIVEQRRQTRAAIAASHGERGVDIGCGPGFLTRELAAELGPKGAITGLDPSPEMLAAARSKLGGASAASRVALVQGGAECLPISPDSLDFAVAVQVYLYVDDIKLALDEVVRVLRPGGRVVIVDTDWESCVWLTSNDERHRRVMDARVSQYAQPNLPRRLAGLLGQAGLRVDEVHVIPILELKPGPDSFSMDMIGPAKSAALRIGLAMDEAEGWADDVRARAIGGDYFFSVNRYLFRATRPL